MIKRLTSISVCLLWGVWLGGLITLFLAVNALSAAYPDRPVFSTGASAVFLRFECLHRWIGLGLSAVSFLWLLQHRTRQRRWAVAGFLVAFVLLMIGAMVVSPKINEMRISGETHSATFSALHGLSMVLYLAQTLVLAAAGVFMAMGISNSERP